MSNGQFVAHLGGCFMYSEDVKTLSAWYTKMLGIVWEANGEKCAYISFPYKTLNGEDSYTIFSILHGNRKLKLGDEKVFTLNLRLKDVEATCKFLNEQGVETKPVVFEEGCGKFSWCRDPEGNFIELWQQ
jgi:predicted enzyme related to lactoylglutathione lyase